MRDRLRRRLLVFAIVALAAMIAVPTVMGWKLIAAYAGMRHEEADPEATISLLPSETMSSAAGQGIAVARDGSIAVADLEGGRLLFYPAASPRVARVLAGPPRGRALIGWAVAFTPEGAIAIVEDSTGLVHFFDRSGTLLRKVKMTDSGCHAMTIDSLGNLYVAGLDGAIHKFLPDDRPDVRWGNHATPGAVPVGDTVGLAARPEAVYVALDRRREVAVLNSRGHVTETHKIVGLAGMLALGPDGRLYMSDPTGRIWILDRSGRTVGRVVGVHGDEQLFSQPRGLACWQANQLWVMNTDHLTLYTLRRRPE